MLEKRLCQVLYSIPDAVAYIQGSSSYSEIDGIVRFYQMNSGVIVATEVIGLPMMNNMIDSRCNNSIYAFHIHNGESCTGNDTDSFADALTHYNPNGCEHPYHAGDLPPLFASDGYALSVFFTDRFTVDEIIGKTVIIHDMPDDFHTQPSGNSGDKIACGRVEVY